MIPQTNSQKMAQKAYQRINDRKPNTEFIAFARKFPTLIHSCGLAQAVAFALAKKKHHLDYLEDLSAVLYVSGHPSINSILKLATESRDATVITYIRMSRCALHAASWLKRYCEASDSVDIKSPENGE